MDESTGHKIFDLGIDEITLSGMVKRRAEAAKQHWEQEYELDEVREKNEDLYLTKYAKELDPAKKIFADNRLFVAVRSITPFLTGRLAQPEVTPAKGEDLAVQFAKDWEKIMVQVASDLYAKAKFRLAVQDVLRGKRVGILKWGYDDDTGELCLEHLDPAKVRFDGDTDVFSEPKFVQQDITMSFGEVLATFPDDHDRMYEIFGVTKGSPNIYEQLEKTHDLTQNYLFIEKEDGKKVLAVVWMKGDMVLGAMEDGLFKKTGKNLIKRPMMPFVWLNFLNDGSGKIDETSFIEQAQYSQKTYERMGQAITDTASYGGSGIPIVDASAIDSEAVPNVKFEADRVISVDLSKSNAKSVRDAFDTWTSEPVQGYIVEDKYDNRNNVDNTFGTPSIFRGEKSDANTLGQDIILRDQAEGRLQEPVDCVDMAMKRFYLLEAQFIFRYFDDEAYFNFLGEDGDFEQVTITREKVAKNAGIAIRIQEGTSLPVDRSQRRGTVIELLKMNKAPLLEAYKVLGAFDEPEKAYKQYLLEQNDPAGALAEVDKAMFNREADEDLARVIGGKVPEEHEDISPQYLNHLNNYLLSDKYRTQLNPTQQLAVSEFVQGVILKAQMKLQKLEGQAPTPQEEEALAADEAAQEALIAAEGGATQTGAESEPVGLQLPPEAAQEALSALPR